MGVIVLVNVVVLNILQGYEVITYYASGSFFVEIPLYSAAVAKIEIEETLTR